MKNEKIQHNGIGFFGILTIALIVLKLCGVINCSWGLISLIYFLIPLLVIGVVVTICVVWWISAIFVPSLWRILKRKKYNESR